MCKQENGCVHAGIVIASRLAVDVCDTRNNHLGTGGLGPAVSGTDGRFHKLAVLRLRLRKKISSVVLHKIPVVRAHPFAHHQGQLQQSESKCS